MQGHICRLAQAGIAHTAASAVPADHTASPLHCGPTATQQACSGRAPFHTCCDAHARRDHPRGHF
eukprot:1570428-Prymnesium_polylepis.1